jgi:hypothetical protein
MKLRSRAGALIVVLAALYPTLVPPSIQAGSFKPGQLGIVKVIVRGLGEQPPNQVLREGKIRDPLYSRYFLRTQKRQKARILFADGSVLNINQHTDAILRDPHHLQVNQGEIDQVDARGSVHRITTNAAVATALGTNFDVKVVNGRVFVTVVNGRVSVRGSGASVLVRPNQQTVVARGRRPSKPRHVNALAIIAWVRGLDSDGWFQIAGGKELDRQFNALYQVAVGAGGHLFARVILPQGARSAVAEMTASGHVVRLFNAPEGSGLAVDGQGNFYVGSSKGIVKYTPAGKRVAILGAPAPDFSTPSLAGPSDIAVDQQGNLYVTVSSNGILKASPGGQILGSIGDPKVSYNGVAIDRHGNIYATGCKGPTVCNLVDKFSPSGQSLARWRIVGDHHLVPQFGRLAVSRSGKIFIVLNNEYDPSIHGVTGHWAVYELSKKGVLRTIWKRSGANWPAAGTFHDPQGVAVDARGNVYVGDVFRIVKLPWFDT